METENKKNTIIITLLFIIIFLIGAIFGIVIKDKITKNETAPEDKTTTKELTNDEMLRSIVGEWGECDGEYNCKGLIISEDNNKYTYNPYIMWSDGSIIGTIEAVHKTSDKEYELTVYFAAYESVESSSPEQTLNYRINIADISSNILYVNNNKYQKVTGDRETFFNNLMK